MRGRMPVASFNFTAFTSTFAHVLIGRYKADQFKLMAYARAFLPGQQIHRTDSAFHVESLRRNLFFLLYLMACAVANGQATNAVTEEPHNDRSAKSLPFLPASAAGKKQVADTYGRLPISFEANHGQSDSQVKFLAHGDGYGLYLTGHEAVLTLGAPASNRFRPAPQLAQDGSSSTDVVRMELLGSKDSAEAHGVVALSGTANYFIGNDVSKWQRAVPTYSKVAFAGIYPGIDLVYYGDQGQLEYDFVLAPNADPKAIRLHFAGAKGVQINPDGDLAIATAHGQIAFRKPSIYQSIGGRRQPVEGRFKLLAGNSVGFTLGAYNRNQALVIDPTLAYATYLGGSSHISQISGLQVDSDGNAYVTGNTYTLNFPVTSGAFQATNTDSGTNGPYRECGFVAKVNSTGTALIYATYLCGSPNGGYITNKQTGIAIDSSGNAYLAGETTALDFPVTGGALLTSNSSGGLKAYITKLDPTGTSLVYSTYLGGSVADAGTAIAVDSNDDAYVTGLTYSSDFPTAGAAYQTTFRGNSRASNAFLTELNPAGSGLLYSTFLGGTGGDAATAIALDSSGNAYVTGTTGSTNFPVTTGAFQTSYVGNSEGFVTKVNPSATALAYSTYLSGTQSYSIAVDGSGNAFVAGQTGGGFVTTTGAFQTSINGTTAGFIAELNSTGSALVYATFLGGSGTNAAFAVALDNSDDAYVVGFTNARNFPITADAFQTGFTINSTYGTTFLTELNPAGDGEIYSTYFGGGYGDDAYGVALDSNGGIYTAGLSAGSLAVTPGAFQSTYTAGAGNSTGYIAKFTTQLPQATIMTVPTASAITYGQTLASSTLSGGAASVPGTFAWTNPGTVPGAGTASYSVTFTPTDSTDYTTATVMVSVTTSQATPTITAAPTASAITYGQALASSTLSGGVSSVPGTFAFTTPTTAPGAGTASYSVTFTPTDATDYTTATTTVSVLTNKATPTITAAPTASALTDGQTLASSTLSGGVASVPGTFSWAAPATVVSGSGSYPVTFSPTNSIDYTTVTLNVPVTATPATNGTQTISFTQPASPVTYGVGPITLSATASSGLPVTLYVASGPANISGSSLTILGAGTVVVAAVQYGNANYAAAQRVTWPIVVNQASQNITFTQPSSPISYGVAPVALLATASSGLPVAFSVMSGPATISGNELRITGVGTVVVAANQAGNTDYLAAAPVTRSITVNKDTQTITFTRPASPVTYGVGPITLSAAASSGLPATFYVASGPANISGSSLTITGTGTVVVAAVQYGNADYAAAQRVTWPIVVNQASQTITFNQPASPVTYGVGPITLSVSASSGLPVTFSVASGPATVSGNLLTITGIGTVVVAGNQGGNGNYLAAAQVERSIAVGHGTQTITFTQPPNPVTYGVGPIILSATASSGLPVSFYVASGPAYIAGTGDELIIQGAGTVVVAAVQDGNADYSAATQVTRSIAVNKDTQTIAFTQPASPVTYGVGPITLSATASSGLPVTLYVASGPATISGSSLTILGAGTVVVAAVQYGNADYAAAQRVTWPIVVNPSSQTITFPQPPSPVGYGGLPIALSASASSSLPVAFSVMSGPATISGNSLRITGVGAVVVAANQAGNTDYLAAAPVTRSITVNQGTQTITFTQPASPVTYGVMPITLSATASSGLPVTFSVTSGPATVSGNLLTMTGVGAVVVTANQTGNTDYAAAAEVSRSIMVNQDTQTITFTQPASVVMFGTGPITLSATTSSNLPVAFSVISGPATVSGNLLTITGLGTVVVAANQAGNTDYLAAAQVTRSITVNQGTQAITFIQPASPVTNGVGPIALSATASSGLPVTFYVVSGPAYISGSGDELTIQGAGTVVVAAVQDGSAEYAAAAQVTRSIVVSQ